MATGGEESCCEQDVEKYTRCPCCLKIYDEPCYLQCGHTMNKKCIRRKIPIVRCFICNESFHCESSTAGKNRFAKDLALKITQRKITKLLLDNPKCSLSQHMGEIAVRYCDRCEMRMCIICNQFHHMNPTTKKHKVYEVGEMIAENCQDDINVNKDLNCEHHENEIIQNWCLDCKLPACEETCSEHHLQSISRQAADAETKIKILKKKSDEGLSEVKLRFKEVKTVIEQLKADGHYEDLDVSKLDWAKQKCKNVIKLYEVLLREVTLLLNKGNELHKCYASSFLSLQQQSIQESTESIASESQSGSARSSASTDSDVSLRTQPYMNINPRQSMMLNILSDRSTYMNVKRRSNGLYANELKYADVSQINSIITESLSQRRSTGISEEILERLDFFDTETRITGMVFVNDTIIVASRSGGFCMGYDIHGKIKWTITEHLCGPFDIAAYKTDDEKQFLFITDPGRRHVPHEGTIHVFRLRENDRYSFEKKFTKHCDQPRGICIASSRVFVCEPDRNEVIEYALNKNGTGKIITRYGKGDVFLKEPMYTAMETGDKIRLLISDTELGLKRVVIHERENNTSGWKSPKGEHFTPSKPCVCKNNVVVGNSTGRKLHFVNFQNRNLSHREYEIEDRFHSPVALAFDSDHGYLMMACKDGVVVIYRTVDLVQMDEIVSEVKNGDPIYANPRFLE
ncbi:uncharacterized protein LOC133175771 [Saccostrea echinata]|uniref:uncharacterized protein LOC133175771 n=1 Tax=Saccostrea echinata TaxID=191078 RepID=UPI002A82090F|nr:uncharacterized protein LOC133175771 [Saccostrea echinata]